MSGLFLGGVRSRRVALLPSLASGWPGSGFRIDRRMAGGLVGRMAGGLVGQMAGGLVGRMAGGLVGRMAGGLVGRMAGGLVGRMAGGLVGRMAGGLVFRGNRGAGWRVQQAFFPKAHSDPAAGVDTDFEAGMKTNRRAPWLFPAPAPRIFRASWAIPALLLGLSGITPAEGQTPPPAPAPAAQNASAPQPELLAPVEAVYSKADAMKARFEIETVNEAIGEVEIETGEIFVRRPNKMKWEYKEPEGKLLLLDGQFQWMYLPEENQAFRGEQKEASSQVTLALLADPGTLGKRFDVFPEPADPTAAQGLTFLRLIPRTPNDDFKSVVLGVESSSGKILAMNVVDGFDNLTKIRFADLELNPRLSDKLFDLKLPKGTELLDFEGEPIEE